MSALISVNAYVAVCGVVAFFVLMAATLTTVHGDGGVCDLVYVDVALVNDVVAHVD